VQEIESGCLLQNCVVAMLLVPHHQHCITHIAPTTPNYLTVLINAITTKVNGYVQVDLPVLKVYLRAVNTTTDYKTDIRMFDIQFIYTPLHVLICRDHHQVVYEYISIAIELSIKINPFFTFSNNIII
jgi:hypothetical protein